MVKDFKINDLSDQLAQNPLNLPFPLVKEIYQKFQRFESLSNISNTFDPAWEPDGKPYFFDPPKTTPPTTTDGSRRGDSQQTNPPNHRQGFSAREFVDDLKSEYGITFDTAYLMSYTNNEENWLTDDHEKRIPGYESIQTEYTKILNQGPHCRQVAEAIHDYQNKKASLGFWIPDDGTGFDELGYVKDSKPNLDLTSIFTDFSEDQAKQFARDYHQQAILEIKKNGSVKLVPIKSGSRQ